MWGAISDEWTGLSFATLSAVISLLSGCTCGILQVSPSVIEVKIKVMLRPTVQSASPSWNKASIWGSVRHLQAC
jgi:hypothetical protein